MKRLRDLVNVDLYSVEKVKQPNGAYLDAMFYESEYQVLVEELDDTVSVSVYGADIHQMKRLRSVRGDLEAFLATKMQNQSDNVSKYNLVLDNVKYRIVTVRKKGVDIKQIGRFEVGSF